MKKLPRGAKTWLICTGIGLAIHTITHFILFPVDLILALQGRSQGPLAALTFLIFARVFLYFIAPGWGLYVALRSVLEWKMAASNLATKSLVAEKDSPANGE